MTYSILGDLTESRMFPSKKAIDKEDFDSLTESLFLLLIALRILLTEDGLYAHLYVRRTISASNFKNWRADGTDVYLCMHALSTGKYEPSDEYPDTINMLSIQRWLREMNKTDGTDETETRRLFLRIERLLFIKDASMRAIRRLVMDWPSLNSQQKRLSTTRLLQMLRARLPKSDLLPIITDVARQNNWEMMGVCDMETGDSCEADPVAHKKSSHPLSKALGFAAGAAGAYALFRNKPVKESDCGTTASSSIAGVTVPLGGIGPGFAGPGGNKGIYQDAPIIRRGQPPMKPVKEEALLEYDRGITISRIGEKIKAKAEKDGLSIDEVLNRLEAMDPTRNQKYAFWLANNYGNHKIDLKYSKNIGNALVQYAYLHSARYFDQHPELAAFRDIGRLSPAQLIAFAETHALTPKTKRADFENGDIKFVKKPSSGSNVHYTVVHDGNPIGSFTIDKWEEPQGKWSCHRGIQAEYQRQGIGTMICDFVEAEANKRGLELVPSPTLTWQSYQFWVKRNPEIASQYRGNVGGIYRRKD